MRPSQYVKFVVPPLKDAGKNYGMLLENAYPKVLSKRVENHAPQLSKEVRKTLPPLKSKYLRILQKYGYVKPIRIDAFELLELVKGERVTEELIKELKGMVDVSKAYNPFLALANSPPKTPVEVLKEMFIGLSGGEFTKPINTKKTPALKYTLYNPSTRERIVIRATRLIDASEKGDMKSRMVAYGTNGRFLTSAKQVRLNTFDKMVIAVVASNITGYYVFDSDSVYDLVESHFVGGSPGDGITVSLIHNRKKSPNSERERKKLLDKEEFIIWFNSYRAMNSLIEYASLVTFDPREVVDELVH